MDEISNSEKELLRTRALEAKKNDFPGRPADDVLTEIENEDFIRELQKRAGDAIHNPQGGISWDEAKERLINNQKEQEETEENTKPDE